MKFSLATWLSSKNSDYGSFFIFSQYPQSISIRFALCSYQYKSYNPILRILHSLFIILGVALAWFYLDILNKNYFQFLQVNDFLYSIYWLSGIRLLAIILFGWLGALGLLIGYFCSSIFFKGFTPEAAFFLGALSALAPLLAYTAWQKLTGLSNDFNGVNLSNLLILVVLHSAFTAIFKTSYFYVTGVDKDASYVISLFMANLVGSVLFLYALKLMHSAYKSITRPI